VFWSQTSIGSFFAGLSTHLDEEEKIGILALGRRPVGFLDVVGLEVDTLHNMY
jgi:hypothetical protein